MRCGYAASVIRPLTPGLYPGGKANKINTRPGNTNRRTAGQVSGTETRETVRPGKVTRVTVAAANVIKSATVASPGMQAYQGIEPKKRNKTGDFA